MIVKVKELTSESFSKFGKVVDIPKTNPLVESKTVRFWPTVATFNVKGEGEVGIAIIKKGTTTIDQMERHVETPEILSPIQGDFILPVAVSKDLNDESELPDATGIDAFYVKETQGIIMNVGVWHWAPIPTGESTSFFVIFKKETTKKDCEIKRIKEGNKVIVDFKTRSINE